MDQGAIPEIISKTKEEFFSETVKILRETADICYDRIKEIPCLICPHKPEGSMFVMVCAHIIVLLVDHSSFLKSSEN